MELSEIKSITKGMREDLKKIEEAINKVEIQEKHWLTTREFALATGLKPASISRYCGTGRIEKVKRRKGDGRYLIHKSELERYNKMIDVE